MIAVETLSFAGQTEPVPAPWKRPLTLVVATDGSDAATAAFTAASFIARKRDCRVHVISIVEPMPLILPMTDVLAVPPEVDAQRVEGMRELVERQRQMVDPEARWTVEIRIGTAALAISAFASETGADLVIVGLHRHGMIGRILGEETAMEIARSVGVPLFVAAPGMQRLPHRVMVAMGIEPDGLANLPDMIHAVADTRSVSCVHVKPMSESLGIDWADLDPEYEFAMEERFAEVEGKLARAGLNGELFVRNGDTTRELAEYARHSQAELVIVGIRTHRGFLLNTGGRLAARMLRHLNTSVLIMPEASAVANAAMQGTTQVLSSSEQWHHAMKGFTARNAGRISTLEVDEPSIGALVEASSYPLLGVDYDHRDGRLVIIMGDVRGTARHLARSILKPDSVSVLTVDGRDTALSVKHGGGQTLLTMQ
jgi:nucleotide-binding universal stress UspA family protein